MIYFNNVILNEYKITPSNNVPALVMLPRPILATVVDLHGDLPGTQMS